MKPQATSVNAHQNNAGDYATREPSHALAVVPMASGNRWRFRQPLIFPSHRIRHHGELYCLKGNSYRLRGKPRLAEADEADTAPPFTGSWHSK